MTTTNNLYQTDLADWIPLRQLAEKYPQFSYGQLKWFFWKRNERPGLTKCARIIGKKLYVNETLFALWLANELPEQQLKRK